MINGALIGRGPGRSQAGLAGRRACVPAEPSVRTSGGIRAEIRWVTRGNFASAGIASARTAPTQPTRQSEEASRSLGSLHSLRLPLHRDVVRLRRDAVEPVADRRK